jgi:RimJ/RimL family protein N-acetyltransferase
MTTRLNEYGQPIGPPVAGWAPRPRPPRTALDGRLCRVEPLDPDRHGADLVTAYAAAADARMWTYLSYGPFADEAAWRAHYEPLASGQDPLFHAILDRGSGRALGVAALMRIDPANGVIEVGHIAHAPALQRSPLATEAIYLLMRRAFDELGYRRCEWKCDALNAASRRAAERLGFTFEGVFRQAVITRGRNRDTAWYAVLDGEWPRLRRALERWLEPANFDAAGRQRRRLAELRAVA